MVKTEHFYQPDPSVPLMLGVVYWKDPDDYQEKLGMPVVIHQLVKPILVMRLLSTYFFGKTKDANKSISNIHFIDKMFQKYLCPVSWSWNENIVNISIKGLKYASLETG